MPRPSAALSTQRPDLRDSFEEYPILAQSQGYVGLSILSPLDVVSQAGTFGVIPLEQIKRKTVDNDLLRSPTSAYTSVDWKFETQTYATQEYGVEVPVDEREEAMFSEYANSQQVSADLARLTLLDALENRICALATNTTDYTGATLTAAVSTVWTTYATATPVADIFNAKKNVFLNTGLQANAIALSWIDLWHLKNCAQFQDYMKGHTFSGPGGYPNSAVAQALGVEDIYVAGVSLNSAIEDAAPSMALAWPTGKIWVGIKSDASSTKAPCAGRTFHYTGDGSMVDGAVDQYEDPRRRSNIIRVRHDVQAKLIYKQCAFIVTGASS